MAEAEGTAIWVDAEMKGKLDSRRHGDQSYTSVIAELFEELEQVKKRGGKA
jgi:hypothetical protein